MRRDLMSSSISELVPECSRGDVRERRTRNGELRGYLKIPDHLHGVGGWAKSSAKGHLRRGGTSQTYTEWRNLNLAAEVTRPQCSHANS